MFSKLVNLFGGMVGFVDNILYLIVVVGDLFYYLFLWDCYVIYIDGLLVLM